MTSHDPDQPDQPAESDEPEGRAGARPAAAEAARGPAASPDPEDWASTAGAGDDERYRRERPPHWE